MIHRPANDEMVEGYMDSFKDSRAELPESLSNRGHSYRHGWLNGRDDRVGKPRARAAELRAQADLAMMKDDLNAQ